MKRFFWKSDQHHKISALRKIDVQSINVRKGANCSKAMPITVALTSHQGGAMYA